MIVAICTRCELLLMRLVTIQLVTSLIILGMNSICLVNIKKKVILNMIIHSVFVVKELTVVEQNIKGNIL